MMALALLKPISIHLTNEITSHAIHYLRFSKTIYSHFFYFTLYAEAAFNSNFIYMN